MLIPDRKVLHEVREDTHTHTHTYVPSPRSSQKTGRRVLFPLHYHCRTEWMWKVRTIRLFGRAGFEVSYCAILWDSLFVDVPSTTITAPTVTHHSLRACRYRTTIIECLKYAITGAFPPGCGRSGNAFVHDPKSIGQTTVKANVKLRFTSRAGKSMVVVRSMELTQKKTTQTFKQLDGVLRMMDSDTGERVSLSHKCSELDKQLPQLLGVSKPILEHVVFCHQEDASWPLQEGAVLKKRFDDIFDSTKYSKALRSFARRKRTFFRK
jgi:AAA domain